MINTLCLVGTGLIGGSLAKDLKRLSLVDEVVGCSRNVDNLKRAVELGFVDRYETDVAWGDMDALQHVNNVVYFRWFESARIVYFDALDAWNEMKTNRRGPILASARCRYRVPLVYPDRVHLGIRVAELGKDRCLMRFALVSEKHGKLAAEGDGLIIWVEYPEGTKTPIPDVIVDRIREIEGEGLA